MRFSTFLRITFRYIRSRRSSEKRKNLHLITLIFAFMTAALFVVDYFSMRNIPDPAVYARNDWQNVLLFLKISFVGATILIGILLELIRQFTIFTTVSIFGLLLGTGTLLAVTGAVNGLQNHLKKNLLEGQAHLVIWHQEFSEPFTEYREMIEKVKKVKGIEVATPYILQEMLFSVGEYASPVFAKGIDPLGEGQLVPERSGLFQQKLQDLLKPKEALLVGEKKSPFDSEDEFILHVRHRENVSKTNVPNWKQDKKIRGMLLSWGLIDSNLQMGDAAQLTSLEGGIGPMGAIPKSSTFYLLDYIHLNTVSIFGQRYVLITLKEMQHLLGWDDEVTGIEIRVTDPEHVEAVRVQVQNLLGDQYEVKDWKQRNQSFFFVTQLEKLSMVAIVWMIIFMAAGSLVGNAFMLVWDKKKEIGILKTLGMRSSQIAFIFFSAGLVVGVLGILGGMIVGNGICLFLEKYGIPIGGRLLPFPVLLSFWEVFSMVGITLFLSTLATLYPAWVASRFSPLQALRG